MALLPVIRFVEDELAAEVPLDKKDFVEMFCCTHSGQPKVKVFSPKPKFFTIWPSALAYVLQGRNPSNFLGQILEN